MQRAIFGMVLVMCICSGAEPVSGGDDSDLSTISVPATNVDLPTPPDFLVTLRWDPHQKYQDQGLRFTLIIRNTGNETKEINYLDEFLYLSLTSPEPGLYLPCQSRILYCGVPGTEPIRYVLSEKVQLKSENGTFSPISMEVFGTPVYLPSQAELYWDIVIPELCREVGAESKVVQVPEGLYEISLYLALKCFENQERISNDTFQVAFSIEVQK